MAMRAQFFVCGYVRAFIFIMKLIYQDHLLIKLASEDVVTLRSSEPNSQQSFFIVYNMLTTRVLAVFENTSQQLLDIFEDFCDLFRNSCLNSDARYTSSPSNNIYANLSQQRFKQTIISAKNGEDPIPVLYTNALFKL